MVTKAKEWRKNRVEGVEITLPSGFTVKLRPIDVTAYSKVGYVPEILKPMLSQMLNDGESKVNLVETYEETIEWFKFLDSLCEFAFVDPKVQVDLYIEDQLNDDEISVNDIDILDKLAVFKFFGRPAKELASFRIEQTESIPALGTSEGNGNTDFKAPWYQEVVKPSIGNGGHLDSISG